MATKWKNFVRNRWVKAVCVLLILAMSALITWQTMAFVFYYEQINAYNVIDEEMLFNKEIPADRLVYRHVIAAQRLLTQVSMGTQESIAAGEAVDSDTMTQYLYDAFFDSYYNSEDFTDEGVYTPWTIYEGKGTEFELSDDSIESYVSNALRLSYIQYGDEEIAFRKWLDANRGAAEALRPRIINDQLNNFYDWASENDNKYNYYVFDSANRQTLTNINVTETDTQKAAETAAAALTADDYPMVCVADRNTLVFSSQLYDSQTLDSLSARYCSEYDFSNNSEAVLIVAMTQQEYDNLATQWQTVGAILRRMVLVVSLAGLTALLALLVLCCGTGRCPDDEQKHLYWVDRIWTEVQVIVWGMACALPIAFADAINNFIYSSYPLSVIYAIMIGSVVLFVGISLILLCSQLRRIKAKQWLNGWIIWRKCAGMIVCVCRWSMAQFRKNPLRRKIIILAVILPLCCAFWLPIPFVIAGLIYYSMRYLDDWEPIVSGAHDIRSGNTNTCIPVSKTNTELAALAQDLNGISDGLQQAVATAVKSERLKSELISNISHDIKTPLTGIITYIDLLKKCDLLDTTAREYIEVLDQKAQRLRILTSDLFDASKATSGAMKVDLAKTDFDSLLRQAIGERSDYLERAGLDLRIQSKPPIYVKADGRLLWRILDNLLSNCVRYAQPNSRVYISITQQPNLAVLEMKNISAAELNISADELMERFTRGDRSRHTEGSGLGLSIAQSLAQLMGGTCSVEIDGDLFKAIVNIPNWIE